MAIIKELRGVKPVVGEGTFVAENASLIGEVEIGKDCSIWYGAVLRGDVGAIRMGNYSNVQDNAILHATYGESECIIGDYVSIGHGANVHGCVIGNDVIIGMGAIVMDNTIVPDGTIIAAEQWFRQIRNSNPASMQVSLQRKSRTVLMQSELRHTIMPHTTLNTKHGTKINGAD